MTAEDEEVMTKGDARYSELQAQIEAEHDRKFIAIDVDSGEYEIARTTGEASRALRKRCEVKPGRLYGRKIGNELEYGLIARILASEMMKAKQE